MESVWKCLTQSNRAELQHGKLTLATNAKKYILLETAGSYCWLGIVFLDLALLACTQARLCPYPQSHSSASIRQWFEQLDLLTTITYRVTVSYLSFGCFTPLEATLCGRLHTDCDIAQQHR